MKTFQFRAASAIVLLVIPFVLISHVQAASDTQAPTVPLDISAAVISPSQVNLTWAASTDNIGVAGYYVYRGATRVGSTATNAYSDTGLTPSTKYTYTVAAYDAAGNISAQSQLVSATTNSATVTGFAPGARVKTISQTNVRSDPSTGSTSSILCTQSQGALGSIISGPVANNGLTWWNVNFDTGCDGWAAQSNLSFVAVAVAVAPLTHNLAVGSSGAEVSTLQSLLAKLGLFKQDVTGYFGAITQAAVVKFQTANALEAVGSVGPKTRALLLQMTGL